MSEKEMETSAYREKLTRIIEDIGDQKTNGIEEFRELLKEYPESVEIMGHLAWALGHRERYEEAIDVYKKAFSLQPENIELKWRQGDRLVNLGRLDEAEKVYEEVLESHPDCLDAGMGIKYIAHLRKKDEVEKSEPAAFRKEPSEKAKENRQKNLKEFREKRNRLESLPFQLHVESTTRCNYYCRTCSKGYNPYYAEDIHPDILEKVRNQLMPFNCKISITGFGEPTLSSRFDEMLSMALEAGSKIEFVTNISLLNYSRIEKLVQHPVHIQLSMDAATPELFEEIRAGSNFARILERLAMIKKLRDICLTTLHFSFIFVALRKNIHELADVVRLAHRFGITHVGVADYSLGGREFDEQSLRYEPERANRCMEEAQKTAKELGVCLDTPPPYNPSPPPPPKSSFWQKLKHAKGLFSEPDRFPRRCHSPWTEPYICTGGKVQPCCAYAKRLGNLKEQSFEKIWNGWRYRIFRWRIESSIPPLGCRSCFLCWGINGGNAGNVMAKEGLLIKGFYFLEVRLKSLIRKIRGLFRKPAPGPEPNWERGRPIRKTSEKKA